DVQREVLRQPAQRLLHTLAPHHRAPGGRRVECLLEPLQRLAQFGATAAYGSQVCGGVGTGLDVHGAAPGLGSPIVPPVAAPGQPESQTGTRTVLRAAPARASA